MPGAGRAHAHLLLECAGLINGIIQYGEEHRFGGVGDKGRVRNLMPAQDAQRSRCAHVALMLREHVPRQARNSMYYKHHRHYHSQFTWVDGTTPSSWHLSTYTATGSKSAPTAGRSHQNTWSASCWMHAA